MTDEYIFNDCSAETPKGRRSVCYDREALESRKEHRPENNAVDMAATMGIEILTEEQYRELQRHCGISQGILFPYFGSKNEFYLYCLEQALQRLLKDTTEPSAKDFYGIIFAVMDEKFNLCRKFPDEMKLVNMAAREKNSKVDEGKNKVLAKYPSSITDC